MNGAPGPPRKPPGAPPATPPPNSARPAPIDAGGGQIRGVGDIKKPPGPPSSGPPAGAMKPPPMAPPPRSIMQTTQRPGVDSIRQIEVPKPSTAGKPMTPGDSGRPPQVTARGPPPRAMMTEQAEFDPDAKNQSKKTPIERKAGAISMFDGPTEPVEKKQKVEASGPAQPVAGTAPRPGPPPRGPPRPGPPPRGPPPPTATQVVPSGAPAAGAVRAPRPLPPQAQPPGIPDGQPLPPDSQPIREKNAPPPAKPPPNRNRAPPRDDAPKVIPNPEAPSTEPPFPRGKKPKVEEEVILKRRDREMPEFESDSDPDEAMADFHVRKVKQPKGLPRQEFKPPETAVVASDDPNKSQGPPAATGTTPSKLKETGREIRPEAKADGKVGGKDAPSEVQGTAKDVASAAGQKDAKASQSSQAQSLVESKDPKKGRDTEDVKNALEKKVETRRDRDEEDEEDEDDEDEQAQRRDGEEGVGRDGDLEGDEVGGDDEEEGAGELTLPPSADGTKSGVMSAFVPPPPAIYEPEFDNSKLGQFLSVGRLSVKVIEGLGIRRKDDTSKAPRTDPFVKIKLGAAEKHPWKQTATKRKQTDNPQLDGEVLFFDVLDPRDFIMKDDLQLLIEIWNKSTFKDECIGTVTMSVVRFFRSPFVVFDEVVPLTYVGGRKSNCKLHLEFVFEEARPGLFVFTLYEARGLRNIDPLGRQDPLVQLSLGDLYKKKSTVVENGGTQPYFAEEELLMWVDGENWVHDLKVDIIDEDSGPEKPIGSTHFCLLPYMNARPTDAKQDTYDLFYTVQIDPRDDREKKEVSCGEIVMKVTFYPAGKLTINVERAKNLIFPDSYKAPTGDLTRIDPYATLTFDGKAAKVVKRTPADKDGGSDPVWNCMLVMDIVDQYKMVLEVFHQGSGVAQDVLIGTAEASLLQVYRNGHTSFWTTLKQRKSNGGIREAGDVFIDLKFEGPTGLSYPQYREDVDAFDDTVRKVFPAGTVGRDHTFDEEEALVVKEVIPTLPDEEAKLRKKQQQQQAQQPPPPGMEAEGPEFTDDEIIAAFKFIDLDHNNFIGAAEIRHILVCMGELITDEEIDTMISMVDMDGDGQVSFTEFRTLVLHPDPSQANLHKEVNAVKDDEIMREKQAMAGKTTGLDLKAFQRQKELTARESKKKMLAAFVVDNEVTFDYVKMAYDNYLSLPKERRAGNKVKFAEFCKALSIEPINEYKILHSLFDNDELGSVDLREFLLSLMNFIEVDKEIRIRFSFTMFDELKTGFITKKEVEEILRGNHMISLASVQRKSETVMKQATANSAGSITMNEFVVISKKFPNILLPSVGQIPK